MAGNLVAFAYEVADLFSPIAWFRADFVVIFTKFCPGPNTLLP